MRKYFFILALICSGTLIGCNKTDMGDSSLSTSIPSDEIHYTTSDGKIVKPFFPEHFGEPFGFGEGVAIVSNTYENGKGIIKFNASVTSIGERAFYGCESLTSITIPESVTSIGELAFCHCESLTNITIPESVTSIGRIAFYACGSLTNMYFQATTPPKSLLYAFGEHESDILKSLQAIYVPKGSAELYKQALWEEYEDLIQEYDFS